MVRARVLPALSLLLLLANPAQSDPVRPELQNCFADANSDQRQRCDEEAFKQVQTRSQTTQLDGGWRLVRARDPSGSADAVSVMHVVDTGKSDANLAGLSLRCGQKGIDVLLIVLEPLSRTTRPTVVLNAGNKRAEFEASVAQTGEALLLPRAASDLATGEWQNATELTIEIETKPAPIRGTVPISGLSTAIHLLSENCATRSGSAMEVHGFLGGGMKRCSEGQCITPVAIPFFLVGAVLAWGFRVWILVPVTLLGMISVIIVELAVGAGVPAAIGHGVLLGSAPQIGYALGLSPAPLAEHPLPFSISSGDQTFDL